MRVLLAHYGKRYRKTCEKMLQLPNTRRPNQNTPHPTAQRGNTMVVPQLGFRHYRTDQPDVLEAPQVHNNRHRVHHEMGRRDTSQRLCRETIAAFIREYIICRFGAPMIIRADNAKSFVNKDVIDLLRQYNVRFHTSTPYYPQRNGKAEASNKTLIWILRRIVDDHNREWHEQLPLTVWAYRISKRSSVGASSYSLVYGEDAILPAEIAIPSARVAIASHTTPDEVSHFAHLDTIEERRDRAERFAKPYRKRTTNYYNQNVKERRFEVDDLVLKIAPHV
ncbi:uncharacterized protein LOC113306144 [Papaver somniferum]|uniref:uncharacterized protein LOC113306144 n=1 Tax=Papaver somniferum TaxID=3469 RepID=UPI000E6F7D16|nr:uncharacterized protein LOC113306144 [Papaver somniferum]